MSDSNKGDLMCAKILAAVAQEDEQEEICPGCAGRAQLYRVGAMWLCHYCACDEHDWLAAHGQQGDQDDIGTAGGYLVEA
jgi:hypothetical protein